MNGDARPITGRMPKVVAIAGEFLASANPASTIASATRPQFSSCALSF